MVGLVDISLNGEFDAKEACKFLKVGLLCTQEVPKLRPSMSSVVEMLTGKMDVDDREITEPGLISDFMDLKVGGKPKNEVDMKTLSSYNTTSASDNQDTTISIASTATTTTFAMQYDHSI